MKRSSFGRVLAIASAAALLLLSDNSGASVSVPLQDEEFVSATCTASSEGVPGTCTSDSSSQRLDSNTTAHDNAFWAITDTKLRYRYHQRQYNIFMAACRKASQYCRSQESLRLHMNKHQPASVYNFTETGFAKMKTPPLLWEIVNDFYQQNKDQAVIEWGKTINPYHNQWDVQTQIIRLDNATLGGGPELHSRISRVALPIVEQWTGQRLSPVSVYGVRIYPNRSILAPHVDRMPLVSSVIINVDQDVEEPWPLEVYGVDGVARNITMEPGDMVLYESHSVIHGRPFPLRGNFFANAFLHFEPIGPLGDENLHKLGVNENGAPPYIIPGSLWEKEWKVDNPDGWDLVRSKSVSWSDVCRDCIELELTRFLHYS